TATEKDACFGGNDRAVSRVDTPTEHHVADDDAATGTQPCVTASQQTLLVAITQMVQCVIRYHEGDTCRREVQGFDWMSEALDVGDALPRRLGLQTLEQSRAHIYGENPAEAICQGDRDLARSGAKVDGNPPGERGGSAFSNDLCHDLSEPGRTFVVPIVSAAIPHQPLARDGQGLQGRKAGGSMREVSRSAVGSAHRTIGPGKATAGLRR